VADRVSKSDVSRAAVPHRWLGAAELALVFVVFFLHGAWPVPDVNEPYYLGKAIHFWNPNWIPADTFLDSADTHEVFYFTFGWLSLWLPPVWLAWTGRLLTWGLLAWAWRRLSFAFIPRRWFSVLTAALFVCLQERYHMAGEWVVGGVEAKGFAYVLVFLGLEALVRNRWSRAWLLLGGAAAFHVLVGGWSVVAAGIGWLVLGHDRPALRPMVPALLGGFALSLPALVPCLGLTWGVDPAVVSRANEIYVFERLSHHLVPSRFPPTFVDRFLLLVVLLLVLDWITPTDGRRRRLRAFVAGALVIAGVGWGVSLLEGASRPLAASLLRFYWFRLSDVAVPLAVALVAARYAAYAFSTDRAEKGDRRPFRGSLVRASGTGVTRKGRLSPFSPLAVAVLVAALDLGGRALQRTHYTVPRADHLADQTDWASRASSYAAWRVACAWIADSGEIPHDARFFTPKMSETFKWYAGRSEVATWKDIPQDAQSIVTWWDALHTIYATPDRHGDFRWHNSLAESLAMRSPQQLMRLQARYQADYVLTVRWPRLPLPVVYENWRYVIYRLSRADLESLIMREPGAGEAQGLADGPREHERFTP
jgi:hypothetical protein